MGCPIIKCEVVLVLTASLIRLLGADSRRAKNTKMLVTLCMSTEDHSGEGELWHVLWPLPIMDPNVVHSQKLNDQEVTYSGIRN
jgi:hypothetical protein